MPSSQLQHGARSLLYVNGNLYGLCTGFSWSVDWGQKEIRGIDCPVVLELGAATVSVSGSLNVLKVIGDGATQGVNLTCQPMDIASQKYVTLLLLDALFQKIIFKSDQCVVTGESWEVPIKNLVTGNINFRAIIYSNETSR